MFPGTIPHFSRVVRIILAVLLCTVLFLLHPTAVRAAMRIPLGDEASWTLQAYDWEYLPALCAPWQQVAEWFARVGWIGLKHHLEDPCVTNLTITLPATLEGDDILDAYKLHLEFWYDHHLGWSIFPLISWQNQANWIALRILPDTVRLEIVRDGVASIQRRSLPAELLQEGKRTSLQLQRIGTKLHVLLDRHNVGTFTTLPTATATTAAETLVGLRGIVGALEDAAAHIPYFSIAPLTTTAQGDVSSEQTVDGYLLDIPLLLQHDPRWAAIEYDSATAWVASLPSPTTPDPTIERWGCALTSASMLLRYHGMEQLPDGTALYPDSLNSWLQSQPDGYVGDGLLNWLALTRLSQQLSQQHGTPALEYSYLDGTPTQLHTEIAADRPPILQLPGHFVLGYGTSSAADSTAVADDIFIRDPWYPHENLSQKEDAVLSARQFTPSYTDLRYLLIATPPDIDVSITSIESDTVVGDAYIESIAATGDNTVAAGDTATAARITQLRQPPDGTYRISILRNEDAAGPTAVPIEIYSYARDGSLQDLSTDISLLQGVAETLVVDLEDGAPAMLRTTTFEDIHAALERDWLPLRAAFPEQWQQLHRASAIAKDIDAADTFTRIRLKQYLLLTIAEIPGNTSSGTVSTLLDTIHTTISAIRP